MSDEEHTVLESGSRKRPAEDDSFSFEFDGDGFKRPALASPGREKASKKLGRRGTLSINDISEDDLSHITRGRVGKTDFEILCVLGSGAFAKVFLVRKRSGIDKGQLFAMKVLKKVKVIKDSRSITNTKAERHILENVNHPFIVNLCYAFQTDGKLYLVLEFKNGGEMFSHLSKRGSFDEAEVRFYAAELVLAIEHLHGLGIIYRDLKLENILLDKDGHVALTDFGLSKEYMYDARDRAHSFAGTVEYMAPEMVKQEEYNRSVDWWALGVLIYELVTGTPPFNNTTGKDNSQEHIIRRIRRREPKYPKWFTPELVDLLQGLLCKNADARLGADDDDAKAIKAHPWFDGIAWDDVLRRGLAPPIKPDIQFDEDTKNFDDYFTRQPAIDSPAAPLTANDLFRGFSFVRAPGQHAGAGAGDDDVAVALVARAPRVHIAPDSEFLARYELTDKALGLGSYSQCYKCLRRQDGRFFAVKIVERSRRDPENEVEMLRLCAGHPHIVQLIDVCRDARHVYIVMELLGGGELFDRIKRKTMFSEAEAREFMRVIVKVVQYLHAKGIVHRDLKPENLLFDEDEEDATLKVVDFGFAKLMKGEGSHALKTPCYTEQYAAPEVLDDDPEYDESCDMWSLGVILYTMLCGYAPFRVQGRSSSSLYKAVQSELRFPAREWDVIGPDAKDLVRHLLDVNPQRRLTPQAVLDHAWLRAPDADAEGTGALATEVDRFGPFNVCGQIDDNIAMFSKIKPKAELALVADSKLAKRRKCKSTDSAGSHHSGSSVPTPPNPHPHPDGSPDAEHGRRDS